MRLTQITKHGLSIVEIDIPAILFVSDITLLIYSPKEFQKRVGYTNEYDD